MPHYHVLTGLKGCNMPDCNDIYETRGEAIKGAQWMVNHWNDCALDADVMEQYFVDHWESRNHCITVNECSDIDCESEVEHA